MTELKKTQQEESLAWVADSDRVCKLVLTQWQRARVDSSYVSTSLAELFRQEKLGQRDRRAVSECVYGMIRHSRRIDEALAAAGWRSGQRAPDRERVLAYLVLEEDLPTDAAARQVPNLDWSEVAQIDRKLQALSSVPERIARAYSLPDWLAAELYKDWGGEAEALAKALSQRAPMTIRANTLRCSRDELRAQLAHNGVVTTEGQLSGTALILETRLNLFGLGEFRKGWFEAQDEASQLVAELVMPPPKARVVDFCAGAGGKTLAVSALMGGRGRLLATDLYKNKLDELRRRSRRAGASNVQAVVLERDPRSAWPDALGKWLGQADRVLVDAPCSGVGSLRRHPEARWRLDASAAEAFPALQLEICRRALELVAPGGRLIYATCTVLRRENEDVVASLLEQDPQLELVPVKEVWGRDRAERVGDGDFLRTAPHRHGCDGFFAAMLRRKRNPVSVPGQSVG